jgi:hypothetical protein
MEKRINQRFEQYIGTFKEAIKNKVIELGLNQVEKSQELVEFVYEYERFILQKDDLNKRKRVKNAIPQENRCNALRADDERCTRKRKDGHPFCGTHLKGTPNKIQTDGTGQGGVFKKIDVIVKEIDGILYYVDEFMNIYKPEDIIGNKENPSIIGKYSILDSIARVSLI